MKKDHAQLVTTALVDGKPLTALRHYDNGVHEGHAGELKRFARTMELIRAAHDLDLARLPELHADARRNDRRRIITAVVHRLLQLEDDRVRLKAIGDSLPTLVLAGTLQERFCTKLAVQLGLRSSIPDNVRDEIVRPLTKALVTLIHVGAPTTRDAAVEGLGALLKCLGGEAADNFVLEPELPVTREENESEKEYEARVAISAEFRKRLQRRRLIVLTVAGHEASRREFDEKLNVALVSLITNPDTRAVETALYERQDLLRYLPGIARQDSSATGWATERLLDAAGLLELRGERRPEVLIAFARFQESVFRTIDAALRRQEWKQFDQAVATAVWAIPRTLVGDAAVCNARIRATVAILRTAIRVVNASAGKAKTNAAVEKRFEELAESSAWTNHGVLEGCYRGLQDLVAEPKHDHRLTKPALEVLFADLRHTNALLNRRRPTVDDLVRTHRGLVASGCFRRLLVALTDDLHERQLIETEKEAQLDEETVDRRILAILNDPTPEKMRHICQGKDVGGPAATADDVDASVIASIAFESELLRGGVAMFAHWDALPAASQTLMIRILAAQLNAVSRTRPELARDDILKRVFLEMPNLSMSKEEVTEAVWKLLSSLPADAAEAGDVEIQRFVDYRGPQRRGGGEGVDDLPGYVLAMISEDASSRIAAAIAREIDLNLRHERGHPTADFAKSLYQVLLRGPHEWIFDHLLPRVTTEADRGLVMLFRRHVARIQHSDYELTTILPHIATLLQTDLQNPSSKTLQNLASTLELYRRLASEKETKDESENVWMLLKDDKVTSLLQHFDMLVHHVDPQHRAPLAPQYHKQWLADLQYEIEHYLSLPINNFSDRARTLNRAVAITSEVEEAFAKQDGLQPPERTLLMALMKQLRSVFQRTVRWYCEQPRRQIEEERKSAAPKALAADEDIRGNINAKRFWFFFCDPPSRHYIAENLEQRYWLDEIERLEGLIGPRPPQYPEQRDKFEEFFVEWRESNLDVETLRSTLQSRWSPWFGRLYRLITSFAGMTVVVLLPCWWAIWTDIGDRHFLEGLGFFVLTVAIVAALVAYVIADWHRRRRNSEAERGYMFRCLLPRLARLIAVPMTLIAELDHSYEFSLNASTWVLMGLMILSFLTTRFVVTHEIVDRKEKPGVKEVTKAEKRSVRKIVALALAHSFGIAVLLSAIFSSTHQHHADTGNAKEKHALKPHPEPFWTVWGVLDRLDETPEEHHHPRFVGFIPREAEVDFAKIAERLHRPLRPEVARHMRFVFYPTIILTWTALGLFFGVFLEGFMKGERLRGAKPVEVGKAA